MRACEVVAAALALKVEELLGVLDLSWSGFRAFFNWLQRVVPQLESEPVANYAVPVDQRNVAAFITKTLRHCGKQDSQASAELVGQYFKDGPLKVPVDASWSASTAAAALSLPSAHHFDMLSQILASRSTGLHAATLERAALDVLLAQGLVTETETPPGHVVATPEIFRRPQLFINFPHCSLLQVDSPKMNSASF